MAAVQQRGSAAHRQCWRQRRDGAGDSAPRSAPQPTPRSARTPDERPYPSWLVGASVPSVPWDDEPTVRRHLREATPVVLKHSERSGPHPLIADLVGRWSFDYLEQHCNGFDGLAVHFAPTRTTRFNRHYGRGLGEGGVTSMSLRKFVRTVRDNAARRPPPWRYYLQAPLVWTEEAPTGADQRPRPQEQPQPPQPQQQQQQPQEDGADRALYRAPLGAELQVAPQPS